MPGRDQPGGASHDDSGVDPASVEEVAYDVVVRGEVNRFHGVAAELVDLDPRRWPSSAVLAALVHHDRAPADWATVDRLLDAAEAAFVERGDNRGRGLVAWAWGSVHTGRGDVDAAATAWREAVDLAAPSTAAVAIALVQSVVFQFLADGDVARGARRIADAEHVAAASGSLRAQANAATYAATIVVNAGRFHDAGQAAARARAAYSELGPDGLPGDAALADALEGSLAAITRDAARAEAAFTSALVRLRGPATSWYEAIVRSLRAEHLAYVRPARSHDDGRRAERVFVEGGDAYFHVWAVRGRASAALHSGEPEAAERLTAVILDHDLNPLERSRALLLAARAALARGDRATAEVRASEALELARDAGAVSSEIEALLLRAEVDPSRFADDVRSARRLTAVEPGRRSLWWGWPTLRVEQLGTQRVLLDGVPVSFRSEVAHQLVHALVLAGPQGISVDDLRSQFWPGRTASQATSSLSSLLTQVRAALGREAWRLERRARLLRLDLDGIETDYRTVRDAAVISATSEAARWSLGAPLLPGWQRESWVQVADAERARLLELLEAEPGGLGSRRR